MSDFVKIRKAVLRANQQLGESGLVIETWGNVSEYDPRRQVVAINPSGVPYSDLTEDDIVVTNLDGRILYGELCPSVDLLTHLEIYKKFPSICGIAHTHSKWATIWAQAGFAIPVLGTTHADFFNENILCTRQMTKNEILGDYETNTGRIIVKKNV